MTDEIEPSVLRSYEIGRRIGKGAYGIVWKAKDKLRNRTVALKKIFDAFQNSTDAQRTFREVFFLEAIEHENIIGLTDVLRAENDKDVYLAFEFMEINLHSVIKADMLADIHKAYILYQVVKALKYIHSGQLIHRDIKPANILLNADCTVKVCDFGLARSLTQPITQSGSADATAPVLTDYIATRWYRAPEILLGSTHYSTAVDMWSVGCILAELLGGKPIFTGTSTLDQLQQIITVVGTPSRTDITAVRSSYGEIMMADFSPNGPMNLADRFPTASSNALDLLPRLLRFNPDERYDAIACLSHPYFAQFHDPVTERTCDQPITAPMNDDKRFTIAQYRRRLDKHVLERMKSKRRLEREGEDEGEEEEDERW